MKASYGTFLTALSTIWLSDFFADLYSQKNIMSLGIETQILLLCAE